MYLKNREFTICLRLKMDSCRFFRRCFGKSVWSKFCDKTEEQQQSPFNQDIVIDHHKHTMSSPNHQDKHDILEDAPEMRSVAIMSSTPAPMPLRQTHVSSKPTPVVTHIRSSAESLGWRVKELKPIPAFYFLERSKVHVAAEPHVVSARIGDFLRDESIAAVFHNEEVRSKRVIARIVVLRELKGSQMDYELRNTITHTVFHSCLLQALAECETKANTRFNVRLWQDQGKVAVEVQRRSGCCFSFHKTAKPLLRAALGEEALGTTVAFSVPNSIMTQGNEEAKQCLEEGLDIAADLLKKDRIDAHALAIETLNHLSKASSHPDFAARCILSEEFQCTLLALVESFRMDRDTYSEVSSSIEQDALEQMHRAALSTLSNCFRALEASGELECVLESNQQLSSNGLLTALVEDVSKASDRPHDACEAIKCIQSLSRSSKMARDKLVQLGAPDAVQQAKSFGACRHKLLNEQCCELESKHLL